MFKSRNVVFGCVALALILSAFAFLGCSSSKMNTNPTTMGAVNVVVSDPATCSGPQGSISHIFVTITDVQIHASSTAGANDPGWIDLTPNLKQNPMQLDLLGQANNQCFLATLGSTTQIQAGTFQQIRIMLAANNATVSGNKCGSTANCVMLNSNPSTPQALMLSSESQTGIKIPAGQLAGGSFTVAAGETKDLDIDINACASIVAEGNGQFRLKPVLHAGEVALTSTSINGKVVDGATQKPVSGGTTIVALEQKDASGVDRVIMETLADSTGSFVFCPVPAGTFDIVADAVDGTGVAYGATVITGVPPGNSLGTVPITVQAGENKAVGSITGQATTTTGSAGIAVDISFSALQSITVNSSTLKVTIPLAALSATTVNLSTAPGTCPANTDCVTYTLKVPVANPSVGAFSTSGNQNPAPPSSAAVVYTIDGLAFVQGGGNTADCLPNSDQQTAQTSTNMPLTPLAGTSVTAQTLAFSGCQ